MGLKKDLLPSIQNAHPKSLVPFSYISKNNIITRPEDISGLSKNEIFSVLRHELQHYLRHITILRDPELGNAMINFNIEQEVNFCTNFFLSALRNKPMEEVVKDFCPDDKGKEFFLALKKADLENDNKAINELFEPMRQNVRLQWNNFRDKVLSEYGVLPEKAKEQALCYFHDFTNIDYYNPDGSLNIFKHSTCHVEFEANIASEYTAHEINNGGCFLKHIKQTCLDLLNAEDSEVAKFREALFEEIQNKAKQK